MEQKIIKKLYTKEDLTIIWEPRKCIHAAICVKALPKVYRPLENPWLKPKNASIKELTNQIDQCPSKALTYQLKNQTNQNMDSVETKLEIMENGPLLVHGKIEVKKANGDIEVKDKITAFCRCGASENKPYCDGKHKKIDFVG